MRHKQVQQLDRVLLLVDYARCLVQLTFSCLVDVGSCFVRRCIPRCFGLALGVLVQNDKVGVLSLYLSVVSL